MLLSCKINCYVSQLIFFQEIICSFHSQRPQLSDALSSSHPSVVRMDMLPERVSVDEGAPRRALAAVVAALKVNGSHGMYTEVNIGDHNTVEMYTKYAFYELLPESPLEDTHILGRVF